MSTNPLLSLVRVDAGGYPPATWGYSPDSAYPEYAHGLIAPEPNRVYAAVRRVFANARLDPENYGTARWNPLGRWIRPGANVFLLCNFVHHRRGNESEAEFLSKCTHASVLRAVADYVLIATGPNGTVRLGNAPLQSGNWSRVLADAGVDRLLAFYAERGVRVEARDLRLFVAERSAAGAIERVQLGDESARAVRVDLGTDSLLDELEGQRFRVTDYDPRRTESFHGPGRHVYVVNRDIIDADVVFSMPKLKVHEKVGITVGLKGFVGAIGHKDCLAHHRRGTPQEGGDEYPDAHFPGSGAIMAIHEWLQKRDPTRRLWNPLRIVDRTLRRVVIRSGGTLGGAWYGNDTAWRMALDIARVLYHADRQGQLRPERMREHLVFIDGVIGGEGMGPLAPDPVDSRMLLFGDDVAAADVVAARYMGFDPGLIPLVARAFTLDTHPITSRRLPQTLYADGSETPVARVSSLAPRPFEAPPGWKGHMEAAV